MKVVLAALCCSLAVCLAGKRARRSLIFSSPTPPELIEDPAVSIHQAPKDLTVQEGESAVLECETGFSQPPATISWTRNKKPLEVSREGNTFEEMTNQGLKTFEKSTTKARLYMPCLRAEDSGSYACIASNGFQTVSRNATVTVKKEANTPNGVASKCGAPEDAKRKSTEYGSPAQIYMWTNDRIERQGANIQLFCRAKGIPPPKIEWYHVAVSTDETEAVPFKLIDQSEAQLYEYLPNGDLLIKNPLATDLGISHTLMCVASNPFGQDKVEVFVMVTDTADEVLLE